MLGLDRAGDVPREEGGIVRSLQNYDFALGGDDNNMVLTVAQMSPAERALLGAKMGREDLEAESRPFAM